MDHGFVAIAYLPVALSGCAGAPDPVNVARETWSETKYHRKVDSSYEQVWSFESDWKPYPSPGLEPMFQPAFAGPLLYVPGAGGSV